MKIPLRAAFSPAIYFSPMGAQNTWENELRGYKIALSVGGEKI
jgi:hypothetical protein